jgi:hypothetical protein
MMAVVIYTLCALTCFASSWLLLRAYARVEHRLLFWSGLCFAGLTLSNVILVLDRVVFIEKDMSTLRLSCALIALALLLYGLIWEGD